MTEDFYSIQETQLATQTVDDLLDSDEIKNLDMKISDYSIYQLDPYFYQSSRPSTDTDNDVKAYIEEGQEPVTAENADAVAGANGEAVEAPVMIGNYQIIFQYEGKIDDVEKFCEKLQTSNDQKTMLLEKIDYSFAIEKDSEGKAITEKNKKGEEENKVSDTDITGQMTLNMLVVEKLPDPEKLA